MNRRGFTLLEMVVVIGVGSVLLISLTRAVQAQLANAVGLRDALVAVNLAKRQMALMNHSAHPGTGTTNPSSDAAFPDFAFTQVVGDVDSTGGDNIRQVRLDVTVGGRVLVRLYTYRTNTAAFGDGV